MPRFQTDDKFDSDPAVLRAGTAAMGLYYRCGIYVAGQLLDGFVPAEIAAQYGTPEWVKRLTDAALWEPVQGGYRMPLYFTHGNPTRDKVLKERQAKSERQQRWLDNKRKASSGQRRVNRPSGDASQDATVTPSSTHALPPSFQEGRGAARPPGAQRAAPTTQSQTPASRPVTEVIGVPPEYRPASAQSVAAHAAAARQALAAKREEPTLCRSRGSTPAAAAAKPATGPTTPTPPPDSRNAHSESALNPSKSTKNDGRTSLTALSRTKSAPNTSGS